MQLSGSLGRRVFFVGLVTATLDQVTKLVATSSVAGRSSGALAPVRNHEFSLGIARASLPVMLIVMVAGITGMGAYLLRATNRGEVPAWVTGLIIGGATSNFADRLSSGSVRDFLTTPWAVVNVADLAVVAGIIGWLVARARAPRTATPEGAVAG